MKKIAYLFPFLLLFLGSCAGYHIGPIQPKFMAGIKTIAVPVFKNDSLKPRIEVLTADTVIRQIQEDGTYRIVGTPEEADAVLNGTITEVNRSPMRSLSKNTLATTEFTLTVRLKCSITRRDTGEVIEKGTVEGQTTYYIGNDMNEGERQALPLAVKDAAVRLVGQISEGW